MTDTKIPREACQVLAQYLGDIELERLSSPPSNASHLTYPLAATVGYSAKGPWKPSTGRRWHLGCNITHDPRPTQPTGQNSFMSFQGGRKRPS